MAYKTNPILKRLQINRGWTSPFYLINKNKFVLHYKLNTLLKNYSKYLPVASIDIQHNTVNNALLNIISLLVYTTNKKRKKKKQKISVQNLIKKKKLNLTLVKTLFAVTKSGKLLTKRGKRRRLFYFYSKFKSKRKFFKPVRFDKKKKLLDWSNVKANKRKKNLLKFGRGKMNFKLLLDFFKILVKKQFTIINVKKWTKAQYLSQINKRVKKLKHLPKYKSLKKVELEKIAKEKLNIKLKKIIIKKSKKLFQVFLKKRPTASKILNFIKKHQTYIKTQRKKPVQVPLQKPQLHFKQPYILKYLKRQRNTKKRKSPIWIHATVKRLYKKLKLKRNPYDCFPQIYISKNKIKKIKTMTFFKYQSKITLFDARCSKLARPRTKIRTFKEYFKPWKFLITKFKKNRFKFRSTNKYKKNKFFSKKKKHWNYNKNQRYQNKHRWKGGNKNKQYSQNMPLNYKNKNTYNPNQTNQYPQTKQTQYKNRYNPQQNNRYPQNKHTQYKNKIVHNPQQTNQHQHAQNKHKHNKNKTTYNPQQTNQHQHAQNKHKHNKNKTTYNPQQTDQHQHVQNKHKHNKNKTTYNPQQTNQHQHAQNKHKHNKNKTNKLNETDNNKNKKKFSTLRQIKKKNRVKLPIWKRNLKKRHLKLKKKYIVKLPIFIRTQLKQQWVIKNNNNMELKRVKSNIKNRQLKLKKKYIFKLIKLKNLSQRLKLKQKYFTKVKLLERNIKKQYLKLEKKYIGKSQILKRNLRKRHLKLKKKYIVKLRILRLQIFRWKLRKLYFKLIKKKNILKLRSLSWKKQYLKLKKIYILGLEILKENLEKQNLNLKKKYIWGLEILKKNLKKRNLKLKKNYIRKLKILKQNQRKQKKQNLKLVKIRTRKLKIVERNLLNQELKLQKKKKHKLRKLIRNILYKIQLIKNRQIKKIKIDFLKNSKQKLKRLYNLTFRKSKKIKTKLVKTNINSLHFKNCKLEQIIRVYKKKIKVKKKTLALLKRKKKIFWMPDFKHSARFNFFLQNWLFNNFKTQVHFKTIYIEQNKEILHAKLRLAVNFKSTKFNMSHEIFKNFFVFQDYNKWDFFLSILAKSLEKQKQAQPKLIKSFTKTIKVFKSVAINALKVSVRGRINAKDRRSKLVFYYGTNNMSSEQYNRDMSYAATPARGRAGSFGLDLSIDYKLKNFKNEK